MRPRAFDVLRHLVENSGRVITKDEFIQAVWRGLSVTDDALVQCMRDVRHALGDEARQIVKTVPRRGYLFSAEVSDGTSNTCLPIQSSQKVGFCSTTDGVSIAMALSGQGMPVIRTATWFNHLEYDWNVQLRGALLRSLADRFQLIRYDGRGTGLSDRYVPEISFATFHEDLEAVIDALQLTQYALLGVSQGAATAIVHAVCYPERVTKLVLNGGFALGRNKRGSPKDVETGEALLTLMRHGWGDEHSAFLRIYASHFYPSASAEEIRALAELQRAATSADNAARIRVATSDIDVRDLVRKVSAPTLVIHSRHDNAVPFSEGCRLASEIPNAKLLVLESENHVPLPGEPAWPHFVHAISSFLAE